MSEREQGSPVVAGFDVRHSDCQAERVVKNEMTRLYYEEIVDYPEAGHEENLEESSHAVEVVVSIGKHSSPPQSVQEVEPKKNHQSIEAEEPYHLEMNQPNTFWRRRILLVQKNDHFCLAFVPFNC
jgi:hypothetical protein